jgi:hypothetical protein
MNINLGGADAGVAIGISVINDYLVELSRIGRFPQTIILQDTIAGNDVDITVLLDPLVFELAQPTNQDPYTRLLLTGTIELRPIGQPDVTQFPLNAAARIAIVLVPSANGLPEIGLVYDGADGTPDPPVTEAHIDDIFASEEISTVLDDTRIPLVGALVEGLNDARFPSPLPQPRPSEWLVELTLMPAGDDTVDSFAVTVAPPGFSAAPGLTESFVAPRTGLGFAYNRAFLDLMLQRGADSKVNEEPKDGEPDVKYLNMAMTDTAIAVMGELVKPVWWILPDLDITVKGPMVPSLIRGTILMAFDTSGVKVLIDESDRIFYEVLKWFTTIGAAALLLSGNGWMTMGGIGLWLSGVQIVWTGDAKMQNAPNTVRDTLAAVLGANLGLLSDALDEDTDVDELRIDATPDSLVVVEGGMVLFAQILVVPIEAMMRSAEYSKSLRRFVIFELDDGRRFRAQELARLMKAGKVTVPGFHQVNGNYLRANPDNVKTNNLLQQFKENETTEVVVNSKRN